MAKFYQIDRKEKNHKHPNTKQGIVS